MPLLFIFIFLKAFAITSFHQAMDCGYDPLIFRNAAKFKKFYQAYNYAVVEKSKTPLIPKIIHQIWIGGPVPDRFVKLMETWKELHPSWEYKLWTDADLQDFPFLDRRAFDRAINIGAKADILRYDILFHFGGVYVDCDFECVKPLDPFIYAHEFFVGIAGFDYVGNAIIGASKGLLIFKKLATLINSWDDNQLKDPWVHTGPLTFTRQVYSYIKERPSKRAVYPTKFFHPFPNIYRHHYWSGHVERSFIESFFIPETFAVHHWAESWAL